MTASLADVAAVVLASRGGARLASALDGVAWAGERIVLDPAGRLGAERLPDGVRWAGEPAEAAGPRGSSSSRSTRRCGRRWWRPSRARWRRPAHAPIASRRR